MEARDIYAFPKVLSRGLKSPDRLPSFHSRVGGGYSADHNIIRDGMKWKTSSVSDTLCIVTVCLMYLIGDVT